MPHRPDRVRRSDRREDLGFYAAVRQGLTASISEDSPAGMWTLPELTAWACFR